MNLPEVTAEYHPQVSSRGSFDARILIVGEAPGKKEVETGVPFVGASGQELVNMLVEAGIAESECIFTNVINIRPTKNLIAHFFRTRSPHRSGEAERRRGLRCHRFVGMYRRKRNHEVARKRDGREHKWNQIQGHTRGSSRRYS